MDMINSKNLTHELNNISSKNILTEQLSFNQILFNLKFS